MGHAGHGQLADGSRGSWVTGHVGHGQLADGSCGSWVTGHGQLADGSCGSQVTKCDPLSALVLVKQKIIGPK